MCSRQIIFLAATASKAWEPLSVAVAGDVSFAVLSPSRVRPNPAATFP